MSAGSNAAIGRKAQLKLSETGVAATYHFVNNMINVSMGIERSEVNCTSHDSIDEEFLKNLRSQTLDVECIYNEGTPGQEIIMEDWFSDDGGFFIDYYPTVSPGSQLRYFSGNGFCLTGGHEGPLDDTGKMNVNMRFQNVLPLRQ